MMSNSLNTTDPLVGQGNKDPTMATYAAGPRRRAPTHPGTIIASAIHDLHTSGNATAVAIGVTRTALGNVLNSKARLTAEMAVLIEKRIGIDAKLLLAMQDDFDLWHARSDLAQRLKTITRMKRNGA